MDVNRFIHERSPSWKELEGMLATLEAQGWPGLGLERARQFGKLYRAASSDLIRARAATADAAVVDYLNDLVARSYAAVYAGQRARGRAVWAFFAADFPRLVREEGRLVLLSAALLLAGAAVGAIAVGLDPASASVMIPADHAEMRPEERVARDEGEGPHSGDEAAAFGGFLFTHNMQVSFFVFALGISWGVGTVLVLFANGLPLGALAVQYHAAGKGLFFWAWILPHGVPELTSVFIAGAAGLVIARSLVAPGPLPRKDALVVAAKKAVRMVLGVGPLLCVAGVIEATISQMHAPVMPYSLKLAFALCVTVALFAYLGFAGKRSALSRPTAAGPRGPRSTAG